MRPEDYPETFRTFDELAIRSQAAHFRTILLEIVLLIGTAAIGSVFWEALPSWRALGAVASGVILFLIVIAGLVRFARKFDHVWFASRAVAESVKIESWRFMMKVELYSGNDTDSGEKFRVRLKEILSSAPDEARSLVSVATAASPQVSDTMARVRRMSFEGRRDFYRTNRLADQRTWYTSEASWNSRRESRWFFTSLVLQVVAAIGALGFVLTPSALAPVGILTTAAAASQSWGNAKRHRELSQSYGMISRELAVLDDRSAAISTEKELARLVEDVERAVSREHTLWIVRRLSVPRGP